MDSKRIGAMASRRMVLWSAGAAALLGLTATGAEAKSSQASVAYRARPKGSERCSNCAYFEPPHACSAVDGPVSANGWCAIWSP